MVIMKFTKQVVIICQAKKTGCIWVIFQIVMMLFEKQKNIIHNLMVATTAQTNAIQVSETLLFLEKYFKRIAFVKTYERTCMK